MQTKDQMREYITALEVNNLQLTNHINNLQEMVRLIRHTGIMTSACEHEEYMLAMDIILNAIKLMKFK